MMLDQQMNAAIQTGSATLAGRLGSRRHVRSVGKRSVSALKIGLVSSLTAWYLVHFSSTPGFFLCDNLLWLGR